MLPGFIPGGRHVAEDGRGSTQNSALRFPIAAVEGCQDIWPPNQFAVTQGFGNNDHKEGQVLLRAAFRA